MLPFYSYKLYLYQTGSRHTHYGFFCLLADYSLFAEFIIPALGIQTTTWHLRMSTALVSLVRFNFFLYGTHLILAEPMTACFKTFFSSSFTFSQISLKHSHIVPIFRSLFLILDSSKAASHTVNIPHHLCWSPQSKIFSPLFTASHKKFVVPSACLGGGKKLDSHKMVPEGKTNPRLRTLLIPIQYCLSILILIAILLGTTDYNLVEKFDMTTCLM